MHLSTRSVYSRSRTYWYIAFNFQPWVWLCSRLELWQLFHRLIRIVRPLVTSDMDFYAFQLLYLVWFRWDPLQGVWFSSKAFAAPTLASIVLNRLFWTDGLWPVQSWLNRHSSCFFSHMLRKSYCCLKLGPGLSKRRWGSIEGFCCFCKFWSLVFRVQTLKPALWSLLIFLIWVDPGSVYPVVVCHVV